jgi:TrwC relaxase
MPPSGRCSAGWNRRRSGSARGHNGVDRFRGSGITADAFDHRTSREGDPQWHTHLLVQNATVGPDGRWSALDSRRLYAHATTADRLYHAALGAELTRRLDVRWRPVDRRTGAAEDEFLGSERAVLVTVDRGLDEPRYSTVPSH